MSGAWINEFHYDNSGTDTGEFIEVAGAAGTDLTDWSLVLYNGSDGLSYNTLFLSGTIADQADGFGTLSFAYAVNGIQNGGPDGIALVDPFGNVVEFVSYEGTFVANDGPALGLTSLDVGVSEDGTATAGGSIALVGTGNEASDFTWQLVSDDTPGGMNIGQSFVSVATADFVNLQFPASTTTITGQATETIYGQIYEAGLTESAGEPAGVIAQLGYGPVGSDPSGGAWVWVDATYNTQVGNNDEYMATLTLPDAGTYSYTFRFAIQDGANALIYTYADLDGAGTNEGLSFDINQLGSLTVNWEVITGTDGADNLSGDGNGEQISGLGGNDQLHGGGGNDQIFGDGGSDILVGDDGDDLLEGGVGDDTIWGGASLFGDTATYEHASGSVQVNLQSGTATGADGNDSLDGVENIVGSAFGDTLVGSNSIDVSNTLYGGAGDDLLDGGEGANSLYGGDGIDTVTYANATAGMMISLLEGGQAMGSDSRYDTLFGIENAIGSGFDDGIFGNDGNNSLNGGTGADHMEGGQGDDVYVVDNLADVVEENSAAGNDEVRSTISYILTANVENLTLIGTANINGSGNGLANSIVGNSGNNLLNGRAGIDTMTGGLGDDIYYVDNAGDQAIEGSSSGGRDTVRSSVTFTLGQNVENLSLLGSAVINATGNGLANVLTGNSAANVLNGRAGADSMRGGDGNDTYVVDNVGDRAIEASPSGGIDLVKSSVSFRLGANVETLTLIGTGAINGTGNELGNTLSGNGAANSLSGLAGNDTLRGLGGNDNIVGGTGIDQLIGGSGADTFTFAAGDTGSTASTADRIHDFSHLDSDRLRLNGIDANSANGSATNDAFTFIGTESFHHVAGELRYQEVNGNTFVYGDIDGDGHADLVVRVDGSHAFVAGDFVL